MLSLEELILEVLKENVVSGGILSAFGSGVDAEGATQFSADTYARGDARVPKFLGSRITKRRLPTDSIFKGSVKKKTRKRRKHRSKRHKKKH
jgi:hypothetical protein